MSRLADRLQGLPTVANKVVVAHPDQTLQGKGLAATWTWGDEWSIGTRSGRWVICVNNILETDLIRVEWDNRVRPRSEYSFLSDLHSAIFAPPATAVSDAQDRARAAAQEFDKMAADLWERRER